MTACTASVGQQYLTLLDLLDPALPNNVRKADCTSESRARSPLLKLVHPQRSFADLPSYKHKRHPALMCRRQILLNAQLCHRALQHSQACGQLQLGLGTANGHQFHAALNAAAAVVQNHQPLVQLCRSVASLTTLGQQQGFWSNRQHCQQWAASLSTTPYSCSEEDLRIV